MICAACSGKGFYELSAEESGAIDALLPGPPVRGCPVCFGSGKLPDAEPEKPFELEEPEPPPDPWAEVDGVVLPIHQFNLDAARKHPWYPITPKFNSMFYKALKARGVDPQVTKDALLLIGRNARKLGIDPRQVRGAWGLECAVFGYHGRFLTEVLIGDIQKLEAEFVRPEPQAAPVDHSVPMGSVPIDQNVQSETHLRVSRRDLLRSRGIKTFAEGEFPFVLEDAVASCDGKPDRVDIQSEIEWVASSLDEWPDFSLSPSKSAIKWWLAITRDPGLARAFWTMWADRRLRPGDDGGRKKLKSTLDEGSAEADAAVDEAALMRRLGMVGEC